MKRAELTHWQRGCQAKKPGTSGDSNLGITQSGFVPSFRRPLTTKLKVSQQPFRQWVFGVGEQQLIGDDQRDHCGENFK